MSPCPKCGGKGIFKTLYDDFVNLHTCENCSHQFTPQNLILKETEMLSNSKLTKTEKEQLRDMIADYPTVRFATDYDSVVCAFIPAGNVMRFAFSVKSPNEQKFRMKVGKLRAMEKLLWNGEFTILPEAYFFEMLYSIGIEVLETE